jgi:cellulose biosynthesis protein BcsQ
MCVFAPKGGVGKTTIAQPGGRPRPGSEQKTVLIDGSPPSATSARCQGPGRRPSILDLPTDRIARSDLSDVLWRDPSGIDILLAPPRSR